MKETSKKFISRECALKAYAAGVEFRLNGDLHYRAHFDLCFTDKETTVYTTEDYEYTVNVAAKSGNTPTHKFVNGDFILIKEKEMKPKELLKDFMRVKYRNDRYGMFIVVKDVVISKGAGHMELDDCDENLASKGGSSEWDIIEIYEAPTTSWNLLDHNKYGKLIWKREDNEQKRKELEGIVNELQQSLEKAKKELDKL